MKQESVDPAAPGAGTVSQPHSCGYKLILRVLTAMAVPYLLIIVWLAFTYPGPSWPTSYLTGFTNVIGLWFAITFAATGRVPGVGQTKTSTLPAQPDEQGSSDA
jgi:hypothetical protein